MKSDFTMNKDKFNHHTASQVCTFHSKSHMEKSKNKAALELAMFGKMHVMLKKHSDGTPVHTGVADSQIGQQLLCSTPGFLGHKK